ncbi:MAG: hypothetical protein ABGY96_05235 [bacterium]
MKKHQTIINSQSIGTDVSKAMLDISAYFGEGQFIHSVESHHVQGRRNAVCRRCGWHDE